MKILKKIHNLIHYKKKNLNRLLASVPQEYVGNFYKVTDMLYKKGYKIKNVDFKNNWVTFGNKKLKFMTDVNYPWIVVEIFGEEIYKFHHPIDSNKKYTVLDLGANRAYAALYFSEKDFVKDIYSFELVPQTAEIAKKNLALNHEYREKIQLFDFGLGKEKETIVINRLENRDGCNTLNSNFISEYMPEEKGKGIPTECRIECASDILKSLVKKKGIENIILKIDVEGAEYDILDDLVQNYPEIFDKITKIVGETHLGFDKFYNKIEKFGFKISWTQTSEGCCCPFELDKE